MSAAASPSTSSPTAANNSLTKIVVAQVFLLLTTLKDDKDRAKWELQADQLKKVRLLRPHLALRLARNAGLPACCGGGGYCCCCCCCCCYIPTRPSPTPSRDPIVSV